MSCASDRSLAPATGGDAEARLAEVVCRVRACRLCVEAPRGAPLPHAPRPVLRVGATARIVIAGQAPGSRVHASGIPFTDPSGDRLREWLGVTAIEFYDRRKIAIVPMGFCFPGLDANGGDKPPRRECAPLWRAEVLSALPHVALILAIGQYAHRWHLPRQRHSVAETVRRSLEPVSNPDRTRQERGADVVPLPHPSWRNNAWLKANPWFEADLLPAVRIRIRHLLA